MAIQSHPTNNSLLTFLNRGVLPFVGRDAELRRIVRFWEGEADADGLRIALLMGEAGEGKSRIIEECRPHISANGGVLSHVKVYPESTTSLVTLLSRSLAVDPSTATILRSDPEPNLPSVADALRRLSRLRPLMLAIEDVHLLGGNSLAEFAQLLDALADETLAILCAARPVDMGARGVIERWLTTEIPLHGFDAQAVQQLWQTLFQQELAPPSMKVLQGATSGNPLAIRSALRGALTGALREVHTSGDLPFLTLSTADLLPSVQQSVAFLADGMTTHLSPEELANAGRLALLGEVFSAEAATMIFGGDAAGILQTLRFRGIISQAATGSTPIPGGSSSGQPPLSFTHTLLHRRLIETTERSPETLWRLCTAQLPLYSFQPFLLLTPLAHQLIVAVAADEAHSGIAAIMERAKGMSAALLETGGRVLLECANAASQAFVQQWAGSQQLENQLQQAATDLRIRRIELYIDQFEHDVKRYLELSNNPTSQAVAQHRLNGLAIIHAVTNMRHYAQRHDTWEEGLQIVERYPELRRSHDWINFLRQLAQTSTLDHQIIRAVEMEMEALLGLPEIDAPFKERCWREIAPFLLDTFANQAELEKRQQLCQQLLASPIVSDPYTISRVASFYYNIGHADNVLRLLERLLPLLKSHGIYTNYYSHRLKRLHLQAGFGLPPARVEAEVDRLIAETPNALREGFRRFVGLILPQLYVHLGDDAALRDCIARRTVDPTQLFSDVRAIAANTPEEYQETLRQIQQEDFFSDSLRWFATAAAPPEGEAAATADDVPSRITLTMLRLTDLIYLRLALQIIGQLDEPLQQRLRPHAITMVQQGAVWIAERELWAFLIPFLDRFGEKYLAKKELKQWRDRAAAIAERRPAAADGEHQNTTILVRMIGTVEAVMPDGSVIPIRGGRLRTVLGLMVADALQKQPLEPREFRHLAAGGEEDPEHARKTMNAAVFRLRDLLGPQIINTEGETPRLNLDAVQVDLLTAHRLLRDAARAVRNGALRHAVPAVMQALELTHGEVPFPTLYEELFEAAREDFEHLLRATTMRVATGLLREEDPTSAEKLLRRAHTMMPEDEELIELLNDSLTQQGKRTEAARLRLRGMMEE